jgi:hydroxyethylthiazole kinase-like uncharacterized protein yjeF
MIELLTTAEMAEADRLTIAGGVPGIELMENAGRAVADAASDMLHGRRVVVVAGPGNNGGDGFVAARHLAERGHAVRVSFVGDRSRLKGDEALAAKRWAGPVEDASPGELIKSDIVIDALFGAGLDRAVEGLPRAMIEAMNASGAAVLAVDLPSGINGTTGAVMGTAVRAHRTVTFFRRKTGHLLLPGRQHCGTVHVADIGIPASVLATIKPSTFANRPELWGSLFPRLAATGHKYARGHAVVVSGGVSTTGAARLAARGALRAGAGLVTIASPSDALAVNAASNLAVMVRQVDGATQLAEFLTDSRRNAVVLGPGGGVGQAMREQVTAAVASTAAVVLDADALTSFVPAALAEIIAKRANRNVVLTPHDGEFSRLFKAISEDAHVYAKLEKARAAAQICGAVLLLKGADTVVAAPDGRASIADNAPPYLATAGAGDVLAGMIGGLMAQDMPAFEAASAAVWLHGDAASEFGPGLIAEDLPEALPAVYRRLYAGLASPQTSD